jgi:hypothetical protein
MKYEIKGTVADWTFYEVTDHGFSGELANQPLYGFTVNPAPEIQPKLNELFANLEHAMVAAVGEKFTGKRGAGGTGVGTAADWFMRMIGAGQVVPADDARQALTRAAKDAALWTGAEISGAMRMDKSLRAAGYVVAKDNTGTRTFS